MKPDGIKALASSVTAVAHSITPNVLPGHDETGGTVASLTEAVMGVTAGLCKIAEAIDGLAASIDLYLERKP